jgi:ferredoxin-type protein NapH
VKLLLFSKRPFGFVWGALALDRIRTGVQAAFTALSNGYYAGFLSGKIYQGESKQICLPGLNCYSCPGALGSCPIGALQAIANDKSFSISMYAIGFLMITGALLGRLVCGWLCPFGLFQDLLYKIPFVRKMKVIPGDRYLKKIKYALLAIFVLILPMAVMNEFGQGDPWFCEYFCPSGTLMAGWPLLLANEGLRSSIGLLFGWKTLILLGFIILSLCIYRPFCRWFCPLGAIYGFFNPVSFYRHQVDIKICQSCGTCNAVCKLNLTPCTKPNSADCIRCGDCIKSCPQGALSRKPVVVFINKEETHG